MKTNLLLVATLLCFIFFSCGKKAVEPKQQVKLLVKITKTLNNNTTTTNITYDDKNRIKAIGAFSYNYNDNNDLVSVISVSTTHAINYANGFPFSVRTLAPNNSDETYTFSVNDGRITKRTGRSSYSHQMTYSGNNLASLALLSGGSTNYYTYGPNKNPFYNARFKYFFMPFIDMGNEDFFSENNLVEHLYSYTPLLGRWFSYEIGTDGFPKSCVIKATVGGDPDTFTFTTVNYTYEMRDVAE